MKSFNMTFGRKVGLMMVMIAFIGLGPLLLLGYLTPKMAETSIEEQAFKQLVAVREIKKKQILNVFDDIFLDGNALAATLTALKGDFANNQSQLEYYIKAHGYYDVFFIQPNGYVAYTASKEADYRTNLIQGPYRDSGLGQLFRQVMREGKVQMIDFIPYAPSNNEPASFVAAPVMQGNKIIGVAALQVSLEMINEVMQTRDGMGETGETYLVGSDLLMRSDSFLDPKNHTVKASFANPELGKVDTDASRRGLEGKSGIDVISDYNGNQVLSAYTPLQSHGIKWILIAEIDMAEVDIPIDKINGNIYQIAAGSIFAVILVIGLIGWSARGEVHFLSMVVRDLFSTSTQVTEASKEISGGAQQLSQGATRQASSLEEISATMEQVASQAQGNATSAEHSSNVVTEMSDLVTSSHKNSSEAKELSETNQTSAKEGVESVKNISRAMGEIQETSEKVNDIIQVINDITHQTKMLATNAAIEAARAGEQGKGFAVVADEVSKLAEHSKTSAKEVEVLIRESSKKSSQGAEYVRNGNEALEKIFSNASQLNHLIEEVSNYNHQQNSKMETVGNQVGSIKTASSEQAVGLTQVTDALGELDQVTQANAASAEQSAAASEELNGQAESLQDLVENISSHFGVRMERTTHKAGEHKPIMLGHTEKVEVKHAKATEEAGDNAFVSAAEKIPMKEDFQGF